jgi:uncharacterized protein YcbX
MTDAELRRIRTYPVKSLDPREREAARIAERGALAGDREYAIVDRPADEPHDPETASVGGRGDYMNGKRTADVHRLRSAFDPEDRTVTLRVQGEAESHSFELEPPGARGPLNEWLSAYFDRPVSVRREPAGGYPDDRRLMGPTVVSTATLEAVADWFEGMTVEGARRRFRANLEVGGVPAFWEDRLYADHGEAVAFRVGDAELLGVNPCQRCVVPSRDPDTGAETPGFRERFLEMRERTLPAWADSDRLDHYFRLMVNTDVPEPEWGRELRVGDSVAVAGTRPYEG